MRRGITNRYQLLFLSPGLIALLLFIFALVYTGYISLYAYRLGAGSLKWVGLENYLRLFGDEIFRTAVVNTMVFVIAAALLEICYGILLALALYWSNLRKVFTPLLVIPMLLPGVNLVVLWRFLLHPDLGLLNIFLTTLGFPPLDPLNDPDLALWTVIVMDVWQLSPLVMLIVLAALSSIPREITIAARVDGAGKRDLVRYIMLPMIKNVILAVLLIRLIDAFRIFEKVYLLTKGGPGVSTETIQLQIYTRGVFPLEVGFGAAMSVILVILSMVVIIPYVLFVVRSWRR